EYFRCNIEVLIEEKVDGILLTAFHDLKELEAGIKAARGLSDKPLFVQIGVQENMRTSFGNSLNEFVELGHKYEVEVLGLSGEVGPSGAPTALTEIPDLTDAPLVSSPKAGLPRYVNDEYSYMRSPDYIGKFAKRFAQAGAKIVGGHSGVHERHIQAIKNS